MTTLKRLGWVIVLAMLLSAALTIPVNVVLADEEPPPTPDGGHSDTVQSGETDAQRIGPAAVAEKKAGGVTVMLITTLEGQDYGSYEDVRGRNESWVIGTSPSNVNYLQAGGALLKGGYEGQMMESTDTGRKPNVTYVDTGFTKYYRGYNMYWSMTGHAYWSVNIGYTWEDNIWADAHHQF